MVVNNSEFTQLGSTGPTSLQQLIFEFLVSGNVGELPTPTVPGQLPVWAPAPAFAGPAGAPGPMGMAGEDGAPGDMGPPGPAGPAGAAGANGATGPAGPSRQMMAMDGNDGDPGPPGARGPIGITGATGPAGRQGPGLMAEDGPQGEQGFPGMLRPHTHASPSQGGILDHTVLSSSGSVPHVDLDVLHADFTAKKGMPLTMSFTAVVPGAQTQAGLLHNGFSTWTQLQAAVPLNCVTYRCTIYCYADTVVDGTGVFTLYYNYGVVSTFNFTFVAGTEVHAHGAFTTGGGAALSAGVGHLSADISGFDVTNVFFAAHVTLVTT